MMWFLAVVGYWALIQEIPCCLNFLKHDCGSCSCLFMTGVFLIKKSNCDI